MVTVKYKSESWLMKIISWILFFNPRFMTDFVTTIGETIYFPDSSKEWSENSLKAIMAHEYIHVFDFQNDKLFSVKYLFPQILSLLTIFVIPFTWWGLLFLLFLLPWPAYWRKKYEVRGYTMSLVAWYHINKCNNLYTGLEEKAIYYNDVLKGSGYYWCWPFGVEEEFGKAIHDIKSGDIFKDDVYAKALNIAFEDNQEKDCDKNI